MLRGKDSWNNAAKMKTPDIRFNAATTLNVTAESAAQIQCFESRSPSLEIAEERKTQNEPEALI